MGKRAFTVVGANYGDEGKGLFTDYLASTMGGNATIVRFNGGSQAGHTVIANGRRHVFGHFGSGTIAGCRSHFSRFFITNPVTFLKEWKELKSKGITPKVTVSPKSLVTTPFDIFINQISERKLKRTASCGLGINETVERSENGYSITVSNLCLDLKEPLVNIATNWVPKRLAELKITKKDMTEFERRVLFKDSAERAHVIFEFGVSAFSFTSRILVIEDEYLSNIDNIIFEGAQGLMLDQDYKDFPWVTRSHTGLTNVIKMFEECDLTDLEVTYVTRTYLTRHGHGPLKNESSFPSEIKDETNIPNKFQGTLRFAPLDVKELVLNIVSDLDKAIKEDISVSPNVLITCCDQLPKEKDRIAHELMPTKFPVKLSYSPCRGGIK